VVSPLFSFAALDDVVAFFFPLYERRDKVFFLFPDDSFSARVAVLLALTRGTW